MKKVLDESETTWCLGIPVETHYNSKSTHELPAMWFGKGNPHLLIPPPISGLAQVENTSPYH